MLIDSHCEGASARPNAPLSVSAPCIKLGLICPDFESPAALARHGAGR
jgi:hypothetical protein